MARVIIGPGKYIQGKGEIKRLYEHIGGAGDSFFFLLSRHGRERVENLINESFKGHGKKMVFEVFNGECTKTEIERVRGSFRKGACDTFVGIGGGKIIDTVKAAGFYESAPVIVVPTIASTDAPCSAISIIYTETGIFSECLKLTANPRMVLVDTEIIAKAPVRFLVSGMGDALSTYFEARACMRSGVLNMAGGKISLTALALSELCYQTLLEDGYKAKCAVENQTVTTAVENIVEANTYLSGIGFESGGLAAAHAIHNGLTILKECRGRFHGEKVAFGTLAQLVLENSPKEEIEKVIRFCHSVGLPVTLGDLGIDAVDREELMRVGELSCAPGETIHNMPFDIAPDDVFAAILTADALGKSLLA
jgi:glycerol dehydrogenase